MKRESIRWAVCLLLFPSANAFAQETRPAPANPVRPISLLAAPAAEGSTAIKPDSMSENGSGIAIKAETPSPVFPDSLMRNYEVEVFQNVLKLASLANFKYPEMLASAKAGDVNSIFKLLDFQRVADGVDALNHSVTCLELIPVVGDAPFGAAVARCSPKLKKLILERLMLAQARTKKTFLRQSLTNWAPITWAHLNGLPVPDETPQPAPGTELQPAGQSQGTNPGINITPAPTKRQ
ncbi:MAG: hypothetical protein DYG98_19410 [Haliscomenobacteraceae bacterium CHB4]|nr:hypothetical protein [Haliscomenobacteraceae bacterium CHB4]